MLAGTAMAERYDETVLVRHKDWVVIHTFDSVNGGQWCEAATGRASTGMSIVVFDNDLTIFAIHDEHWSIPKDAERYVIVDVDYERFDGWARADGNMLSLRLTGDTGANFLTQMRLGSAVAVYNSDERRIAAFSLRGSAAAMAKLAECWSRIRLPDQADPFRGVAETSEDPFL
jgi:hypothetical protein